MCEVTDSPSLPMALEMLQRSAEWVLRGEAHLPDASIIARGSGSLGQLLFDSCFLLLLASDGCWGPRDKSRPGLSGRAHS